MVYFLRHDPVSHEKFTGIEVISDLEVTDIVRYLPGFPAYTNAGAQETMNLGLRVFVLMRYGIFL